MAKYNVKAKPTITPVTNHQGGIGYAYDAKSELVAILATGIDNKYYEKEGERENRLATSIAEVAKKDKTFVAKALVYARSVMGQRTVTHLGAAELAKVLRGDPLGTRFYSKRIRNGNSGGVVYRLDDMLEIAACYQAKNPGKGLSNAIKKGFKLVLESADEYELAKYQASNRDLSLVDIVNLVHPKPSEKMAPIFAKLMKGELKQFNTVEDKNTKAGQEVAAKVKTGKITKEEAAVELAQAKEDNYAELIKTRKIGYLALLRNLRNILKTGTNGELIADACELLTDTKLIKQSLVFPHQIDLALEIMLAEFGASKAMPFIKALNKAYELAIPNLTELFPNGKTAVVFDSSGSMSTFIKLANKNEGSEASIAKAALIASTLAKGIGADVYHFADTTAQIKFNPLDTVNTLKNQFLSKQGSVGYGTSFNSIMKTLGDKYDRIFVISDMQSGDTPFSKTRAHIYSINIAGYGTTSIKPNNKVYQLFGYSADIYELVKKVEISPLEIIKAIEAIEI
ncbi:MAG: TROVE domain-containing protein [Bacteroidetes bacterium]|nr:TROVE domain-containing protein [Bacteroidota bacterium]